MAVDKFANLKLTPNLPITFNPWVHRVTKEIDHNNFFVTLKPVQFWVQIEIRDSQTDNRHESATGKHFAYRAVKYIFEYANRVLKRKEQFWKGTHW